MIIIQAYILTDRNGEWWETLKKDGSLNRFSLGKPRKDMTFRTVKDAIKTGDRLGTRYKVLELTEPTPPSITWTQKTAHEGGMK